MVITIDTDKLDATLDYHDYYYGISITYEGEVIKTVEK